MNHNSLEYFVGKDQFESQITFYLGSLFFIALNACGSTVFRGIDEHGHWVAPNNFFSLHELTCSPTMV